VKASWKSNSVFITNDAVPAVFEQMTTKMERAPMHSENSIRVNMNENQFDAVARKSAIQ
jgi:hypothetical protein